MLTSNIHHANKVFFDQFWYVEVSQKSVLVKGAETENICKPPSKATDDTCTRGWLLLHYTMWKHKK